MAKNLDSRKRVRTQKINVEIGSGICFSRFRGKRKLSLQWRFWAEKKPVGNFSQSGGGRWRESAKLSPKRRKHSFAFPGRTAERIALEYSPFEQGQVRAEKDLVVERKK